MKIYLAGPDVFRPDVETWAQEVRLICQQYGFEPLLPIDHTETDPARIFEANLALIRKAQVVCANLDRFRGAEPDSGTAFELGYAHALGKKLGGYVTRLQTQAQRVEAHSGEGEGEVIRKLGRLQDGQGWSIEDFNLPCNLMLATPTLIVEGGLEACLRALRPPKGGKG